jgi:hypothetical protein
MEISKISRADMLREAGKSMGCRGGTKKLPLYPTNLTTRRPVMVWKGLWVKGWRRVVECVGIFLNLWVEAIQVDW